MRLLCTGDVHLGRRPTRIPEHLVPDQTPFSTRAIWERIVTLAIDEQVDALLISGDLVDHDNRFFEALGPIDAGITRLAAAGIPAIAVAGNHDYDVLPPLADRFGDAFRLLGRKQTWERFTLLDKTGDAQLHIDGWSFDAEHVVSAPLDRYEMPASGNVPVVGLLHTDLDQTNSRYAPSRLEDLRSKPVAAWLIGHIHAPALHQRLASPPVLYPGSPSPLDPGEPGSHGVWFLDIEPDRPAQFTFRPIARLRYQRLSIDVTGALDARSAGLRIFDSAEKNLLDLESELGESLPDHILYRVHLTGRVSFARRTADFDAIREQTGGRWSIDQLTNGTRPEVDLEELAKQSSPPGAIARLIKSLDEPGAPASLLSRARSELERSNDNARFARIQDESVPDGRTLLENTAWELLDALLEQRETSV